MLLVRFLVGLVAVVFLVVVVAAVVAALAYFHLSCSPSKLPKAKSNF